MACWRDPGPDGHGQAQDLRGPGRAELPPVRRGPVPQPDRHLGGDCRPGATGAAPDPFRHDPGPDHRGALRADPAAVPLRRAGRRPAFQTARADRHPGRARPGLGDARRERADRDIRLWQVVVLALLFGTLSAVDNPARQAFVPEVVGRDLIRDAVTLNSTTVNVARVIGPTIAAILVATVGIGWCFVVNAVSFMFVIASLLSLDTRALHQIPPVPRAPGELREGLRYAARVPAIAGPLLMMALIGTFTFEFEVSLPLLARTTFHGGATAYSWLIGALGAGAVVG